MAQEREFLRFIRNNHLPLFLRLVGQSQFNRSARASYGFRLLALTLDGVIVGWNLFAANAAEREGAQDLGAQDLGAQDLGAQDLGAQDLLDDCFRLRVLGDKGFLDRKRQAVLEEDRGLLLLTPKRRNQRAKNVPAWDALMNGGPGRCGAP